MIVSQRSRTLAILLVGLLVAACGSSPTPPQSAGGSGSEPASPSATAQPTPGIGEVVPAPGSASEVYAPNPGAIVVAIDPGHGGCLDWGVPNPYDNKATKAEKADTLGIGLALQQMLEAQGVTVVMTRTDDSALAGDNYPALGCNGPEWRDVDGNGEAGFEETGRTRTRDELQARIDMANLARADVMVSIHINQMTQGGVIYEIAATQTFYDDETPWGESGSGELGRDVQAGVVDAFRGVATYERQDRATGAVAYYLISRQWREGDTCEVPGDTWCKPHRGLQLPGILSEVGSMSLEAESELLATDAGRQAAARGVYRGLVAWFGARPLAVRYDALLPGGEAGTAPAPVDGPGAPFRATSVEAASGSATIAVRLTNTGAEAWPAGLQLMLGWTPTDAPYLAVAPSELEPVDLQVPALAPGESVILELPLAPPAGPRAIAWVTLAGTDGPFTDLGSPALQLATVP